MRDALDREATPEGSRGGAPAEGDHGGNRATAEVAAGAEDFDGGAGDANVAGAFGPLPLRQGAVPNQKE